MFGEKSDGNGFNDKANDESDKINRMYAGVCQFNPVNCVKARFYNTCVIAKSCCGGIVEKVEQLGLRTRDQRVMSPCVIHSYNH